MIQAINFSIISLGDIIALVFIYLWWKRGKEINKLKKKFVSHQNKEGEGK